MSPSEYEDFDMTESSSSTPSTQLLSIHKNWWRRLLTPKLTSCISSSWCEETAQPSEKAELLTDFTRSSSLRLSGHQSYSTAYSLFLYAYPEYRLTSPLDYVRATDYTRLQRGGEVYVDYMGGSLYPESLVRSYSALLQQIVLGNTHSISTSSRLSSSFAKEARETVLSFFGASAHDYTVIFTPNATGALKLVGESYPFKKDGSYVLGVDSHNSVHGIRQFAIRGGSRIVYIESTSRGGFDMQSAKDVLKLHQPQNNHRSLFALTGASNVSNAKVPLSILEYASDMGYNTLLDAAALAPTTRISLKDIKADAMAVSFYKMFGFPTGVGALIAKKSFLAGLNRPWFAGGTVDIVQVPGSIVTMASELHEQFEDGTVNYASLPAITDGLRFLKDYIAFLPLRLSCLVQFLVASLSGLRHERTGRPVVRIVSRLPTTRLRFVGEQSDTGSTISFIFLSPEGEMLPLAFAEFAASQHSISLRTGCMCNPGGAAAILGFEHEMQKLYEGVQRETFEHMVGRDLGVIRISLGLASNFYDAWCVVKFAEDVIGRQQPLKDIFDEWISKSHEERSCTTLSTTSIIGPLA